MSKVYGYCRLAFENEEEMAEQAKLIEDYCKDNDLKLDSIFYDNGVSGIKLERDGLNKMLSVLQKGDIIIVKNLARLTRSIKHCMVLTERIEEIGATLRVID